MNSSPLAGKRVAVTRAREQAPELGRRLVTLGAEVIELPLISVRKDIDKQTLADVLLELGTYDWIVFTSANGVRCFFEEFHRIFDDIRSLGLLRFAAVGDTTAAAIREQHLRVECQPTVATGDSLAEALIATGSLDSAKILVITGNLNRDTLVRRLEEARAIVDRLPVYRTEPTDLAADAAAADFRRTGADAILFASASAVESYATQAAALRLADGARRPLAGSIGPLTTQALRKAGLEVSFEAASPSLDDLVTALLVALKR
jgi:uroporphyrinogen-III synthase